MSFSRASFNTFLLALTALPALIVGITTMRHWGVGTTAWAINIGATVVGLMIWAAGRRLPPPRRPATVIFIAAAGIVAIILPFASGGLLGVHRWISLAGLRLHTAAIVAPLIILCVAAAALRGVSMAIAIGSTATLVLALQPDAAQTTSLAAACAVILVGSRGKQTQKVAPGLAALLAISIACFVRPDALPPVAHVEEIFGLATSRGPGWAVMATVALMLLPVPFFAAWHRRRGLVTLAIGVYVALTLLAPAWGTYPVPIMGSGASPIVGYFVALAAGIGRPSHFEEMAGN